MNPMTLGSKIHFERWNACGRCVLPQLLMPLILLPPRGGDRGIGEFVMDSGGFRLPEPVNGT
jgi:hypothetical protein